MEGRRDLRQEKGTEEGRGAGKPERKAEGEGREASKTGRVATEEKK